MIFVEKNRNSYFRKNNQLHFHVDFYPIIWFDAFYLVITEFFFVGEQKYDGKVTIAMTIKSILVKIVLFSLEINLDVMVKVSL